MNDKFDELAKGLAESVTRRGALKKFGAGLAGVVLGALGLVNKAQAGSHCINQCRQDCTRAYRKGTPEWDYCFQLCAGNCPLGI
jgi:hypothetical protein